MTTRAALQEVLAGGSLSRERMRELLAEVFEGQADEVAFGGLLVALASRGETREEILGAAQAMREVMSPFEHDLPEAIDTCGTGGSGLDTFNISTASAIVACAAGAKVIKHGNRSASSKCGSADLLEGLGLPLDLTPQAARAVLEEVDITFLFAPSYHPAMRHAGPIRRSLGVRTIFNLLGPLCNPGRVKRQVLGVFDAQRARDLAWVLNELGTERGLVLHGAGGADELTLEGENLLLPVGEVPAGGFDAVDLQLEAHGLSSCCGGDVQANVETLRAILDGKNLPARHFVQLNSAAALVVSGQATSPWQGVELAREAIDSGAARSKLQAWVDCAQDRAGSA